MDDYTENLINSDIYTPRNNLDIYESNLPQFGEDSESHDPYSQKEPFDNNDCLPMVPVPALAIKISRKRKRQKRANGTGANYHCAKCNVDFQEYAQLQMHRQQHVHQKPHKCDKCQESFNVWDNLLLHTATHNSTTPAECPRCHIFFNRISSFHGHIQTHFQSEYFTCDFCQQTFNFEAMLKEHVAEKHPNRTPKVKTPRKIKSKEFVVKDKRHQCSVCQKKFEKPSGLERHLLIHKGQRPFKCDKCEFACNQKSTLEKHKLIHNGMKPFNCPKCPQRFNQRGNLSLHLKRVHPVDDLRAVSYPCNHCSCVYSKMGALNAHIKRVHEVESGDVGIDTERIIEQLQDLQNGMEPAATNCSSEVPAMDSTNDDASADEGFIQLQDLAEDGSIVYRLVKRIFIDNERFLVCVVCSKKFRRPSDLLRHLKVHTKEKPFECNLCLRRFALKTTLSNHLRVHEAKKVKASADEKTISHECSQCSAVFDTEKKLKVHLETHERELIDEMDILFEEPIVIEPNGFIVAQKASDTTKRRPHHCEFCSATFTKISHLKQHVNSHLGLKPYQCPICNKYFGKSSILNEHMLKHQSKVIECNQCTSRFYNQSTYLRHQANHSQNLNILCPYCQKSFKSKGSCKSHIKSHKYDILKEIVSQSNGNSSMQEQFLSTEDTSEEPHDSIMILQNDAFLPTAAQNNSIFLLDSSANLDMQVPNDINDTVPDCSTNLNMTNDNPTLVDPVMWMPTPETIQSQNVIVGDVCDMEDVPGSSFIEENNQQYFELINDCYPIMSASSNPNPMMQVVTIVPEIKTNEKELITVPKRENRCNVCDKSFLKLNDLTRHMRVHTGERPFACNICLKQFKLQCTLNSHLSVHQEQRTIFNCQTCSKGFTSRNSLRLHMSLHTGKRPYKCSSCALTFRTIGNRNSHEKVHSKVTTAKSRARRLNCQQLNLIDLAKTANDFRMEVCDNVAPEVKCVVKKKLPYSCLTCLKTFEKKSILTRHELIHTEERPFVCSICNERFNQKATLSTHMRIHSSVLPYGCDFCWQTFRFKGNRTKHMLICKAKDRIREDMT